jgi:hypothetical protein
LKLHLHLSKFPLPKSLSKIKVKSPKIIAVIVGGVILAIAGGSTLLIQHTQQDKAVRNTAASTTVKANADQLKSAGLIKNQLSPTNAATSTPDTSQNTSDSAKSSSTAGLQKYATSSDPRSTAWSYTPPAPDPSNINIAITGNNQVSPGTLISYNATKHERAYYGGDLILSPSTVTVSKSSGMRIPFTVAIPDGATSNMPSMAWNDYSKFVSVSYDTANSPAQNGTSWMAQVEANSWVAISPGAYVAHLSTHRSSSGADSWQYDGFLTVNIVE